MASVRLCAIAAVMLIAAMNCGAQRAHVGRAGYVGFDRNDYPGDAALPGLRKTFEYTSYWLNAPPGEQQNAWAGKRALLKRQGFGFLVLFNGRLYAELKGKDAAALGAADGKVAAAAAMREGFARDVVIFLDQEEGGRLLNEQAAYLFAWVDAVRAAGARAGVYCSGIEAKDTSGTTSTALDIVQREATRTEKAAHAAGAARLKLWVANDACPPSPGCSLKAPGLGVVETGELAGRVAVWQYAQSPRRMQFTDGCPANYAPDGKCYATAAAQSAGVFVDLNVANSADPSEMR